jgi:hypothetical protein
MDDPTALTSSTGRSPPSAAFLEIVANFGDEQFKVG